MTIQMGEIICFQLVSNLYRLSDCKWRLIGKSIAGFRFIDSHKQEFPQTFGDRFGKYTSFQYNGNSVVDYGIVSDCLVDNVLYFHVHDHIPHLSDHAKLSMKLSV